MSDFSCEICSLQYSRIESLCELQDVQKQKDRTRIRQMKPRDIDDLMLYDPN